MTTFRISGFVDLASRANAVASDLASVNNPLQSLAALSGWSPQPAGSYATFIQAWQSEIAVATADVAALGAAAEEVARALSATDDSAAQALEGL